MMITFSLVLLFNLLILHLNIDFILVRIDDEDT